ASAQVVRRIAGEEARAAECGSAAPRAVKEPAAMTIDAEFLAILACPACKSELILKDDERLVCTACRRSYPIRDGFPILLIDEATLEPEEEGHHGETATRSGE